MLLRTHFDPHNPDRMGIIRLLSRGAYKAAYPLHDGRYDKVEEEMNDRRVRALTLRSIAFNS